MAVLLVDYPILTVKGVAVDPGKTHFAQMMDFVPWTGVGRIVAYYSGEARVSILPRSGLAIKCLVDHARTVQCLAQAVARRCDDR